jgi:hypothetical protein
MKREKDKMLCWNPGTDQVALVDWPDRIRASDKYEMTQLGCFTDFNKASFGVRKTLCFIEAMHLIVRDKCDPQAVHKAMLGMEEYLDGCSDDMPGVAKIRYKD